MFIYGISGKGIFFLVQHCFSVTPCIDDGVVHFFRQVEDVPAHQFEKVGTNLVPFLEVEVIIVEGKHTFLGNEVGV